MLDYKEKRYGFECPRPGPRMVPKAGLCPLSFSCGCNVIKNPYVLILTPVYCYMTLKFYIFPYHICSSNEHFHEKPLGISSWQMVASR
jgi:hypothetical protein